MDFRHSNGKINSFNDFINFRWLHLIKIVGAVIGFYLALYSIINIIPLIQELQNGYVRNLNTETILNHFLGFYWWVAAPLVFFLIYSTFLKEVFYSYNFSDLSLRVYFRKREKLNIPIERIIGFKTIPRGNIIRLYVFYKGESQALPSGIEMGFFDSKHFESIEVFLKKNFKQFAESDFRLKN